MGFIYDRRRIQTRQLYAELALVDRGRKTIKVEFRGKELNFHGFNRNPFMVAFAPRRPGRRKTFDFTLVNVHLYYGAAGGRKLRNRLLEVMALTKWAQKRTNTKTVYDDNIILLGDMNLPSLKSRDLIYRALKRRGLSLTKYSTDVDKEGTNLSGSHPYDQIAISPQKTGQDYTGETGVFDFDSALFPDLYDEGRGLKRLRAYLKYYISDHRLLWAAFKA